MAMYPDLLLLTLPYIHVYILFRPVKDEEAYELALLNQLSKSSASTNQNKKEIITRAGGSEKIVVPVEADDSNMPVNGYKNIEQSDKESPLKIEMETTTGVPLG